MILYPGLFDFTKEEILAGNTTKNIYQQAITKFNYSSSIETFYKYISRVKKTFSDEDFVSSGETSESIESKFITLLEKKKSVSGQQLCEELSCSPQEVYELVANFRKRGYEIICDEKNIILSTDVICGVDKLDKCLEDKEIIFGVASDIHFGSKACQLTALNEFCHICRKNNVKYMFVPGDLCAGFNVYPGQQFEVYAQSAEEQEASVIVNLPVGFEWYAIGGNHDYSFIKRGGGHNVMLAIESQRKDFHYVGFDDADVPILPGVDLKMWHPSGGVPYSYSYRMQKGVEQITYTELANISRNVKEKPSVRFLLAGHLHIQMQAMFGSIFGMQCGSFEGQTGYLKRKGLYPVVGGYIVKADITKDGLLRNFSAKFYMWPRFIEDDWKNYKHTISREPLTVPIFS